MAIWGYVWSPTALKLFRAKQEHATTTWQKNMIIGSLFVWLSGLDEDLSILDLNIGFYAKFPCLESSIQVKYGEMVCFVVFFPNPLFFTAASCSKAEGVCSRWLKVQYCSCLVLRCSQVRILLELSRKCKFLCGADRDLGNNLASQQINKIEIRLQEYFFWQFPNGTDPAFQLVLNYRCSSSNLSAALLLS